MTKLFRTITFALILVGLLAWGVTTLALSTSTNKVSSSAKTMHGHVMDNGKDISRSQIQPYRP